MSPNLTTLLAAALAVFGTLTSVVLTQRYANRARAQEIEAVRNQRQEDREEERRRASLLDRRQSYTALHAAAWDFRLALKNCLFDEDAAEELERARQAFVTSYRNSQMIATDAVFRAMRPIYDELTNTYGRVKKLTGTASELRTPLSHAELSAVQGSLDTEVVSVIRAMRDAMRADLGILDPDDGYTSAD